MYFAAPVHGDAATNAVLALVGGGAPDATAMQLAGRVVKRGRAAVHMDPPAQEEGADLQSTLAAIPPAVAGDAVAPPWAAPLFAGIANLTANVANLADGQAAMQADLRNMRIESVNPRNAVAVPQGLLRHKFVATAGGPVPVGTLVTLAMLPGVASAHVADIRGTTNLKPAELTTLSEVYAEPSFGPGGTRAQRIASFVAFMKGT